MRPKMKVHGMLSADAAILRQALQLNTRVITSRQEYPLLNLAIYRVTGRVDIAIYRRELMRLTENHVCGDLVGLVNDLETSTELVHVDSAMGIVVATDTSDPEFSQLLDKLEELQPTFDEATNAVDDLHGVLAEVTA